MPDFLQPGQTQLVCRRKFLSGLGAAAALPPVVLKRSTPQRNSIWIPIANLPRPKFYLGQQVTAVWDPEYNEQYRNRAIIIGMEFEPSNALLPGWFYLPRWIENEACPNFVGRDDGHYCPEEQLRAIDEWDLI